VKRIVFRCAIIFFAHAVSTGFAGLRSDHDATEATTRAAGAVEQTPRAIAKSGDGYLYLAGNSYSHEEGGSFWVWKLTSSGEKVWEKKCDARFQEEVKSIISTPDGGVLVLGQMFVHEPEAGYQSWIKQFDKNGEVVFTRDVGGLGRADVLLKHADGNYLFAGASHRKGTKQKVDYDFRLVKFDPKGSVAWEKFYDKGADESAFSGAAILRNGYVFAGTSGKYSRFGEGTFLGWLVKIDYAGALLAEAKLPDCAAMSEGQRIVKNGDEFAVVYSTVPPPPLSKTPLSPLPFRARIIGFKNNLKPMWSMNRVGYSSVTAPLIALSQDKHYLVAGAVKEGLKIDKIARGGKLVWEKTIEYGKTDHVRYDITGMITSGNNAYIVGSAVDVMNSSGASRVFFLKIESGLGEVLVKKLY
jgi:hypothetical protein